MLEKIAWEKHSKPLSACLLLASTFLQDESDRSTQMHKCGVLKSHVDLHASMKALKALGTLEEAASNDSFQRYETSIMVIAARGKTLLTKAKDGKLWPMDPLNRLASFEALLSEVDAKIQEHAKYFITAADARTMKAVKLLRPLSGGAPDGKKWSQGIKERFFFLASSQLFYLRLFTTIFLVVLQLRLQLKLQL